MDLAHVRTEFCWADCLTKAGCKPDSLTEAVRTGILPYCDAQPLFRQSMQHKAYAALDSRDHWVVEGSQVRRVHCRPRRALFVPQEGHCPVPLSSLEDTRDTSMNTHRGPRRVQDSWRSEYAQLAWHEVWTGETVFRLRNKRLHPAAASEAFSSPAPSAAVPFDPGGDGRHG